MISHLINLVPAMKRIRALREILQNLMDSEDSFLMKLRSGIIAVQAAELVHQ